MIYWFNAIQYAYRIWYNNSMCVVLFVCWLYVCVCVWAWHRPRSVATLSGDGREVQPCGAAGRPDRQLQHIWVIPRLCQTGQNTTQLARQAMWHKCLVKQLGRLMSHGKIMVSIQYDSAANLTPQQPMIHCNWTIQDLAKRPKPDTTQLDCYSKPLK